MNKTKQTIESKVAAILKEYKDYQKGIGAPKNDSEFVDDLLQLISQERTQWEDELREKIDSYRKQMTLDVLNRKRAIPPPLEVIDDIRSLLESKEEFVDDIDVTRKPEEES